MTGGQLPYARYPPAYMKGKGPKPPAAPTLTTLVKNLAVRSFVLLADTKLSQEAASLLKLDKENDFFVPAVDDDTEIQLLRDFTFSIVFPVILQEVP